MKKSLLLLSTLLATGSLFSQNIIFSENFDASTAWPTGWARYNVDGLTPAANVNFVTEAWVVRSFQGENLLTSTSWYAPAATSNDWVVTPAIAIPATGTYFLNFDVQAQDPTYRDGYKLYVSTTGNTVADFAAAPIASVASAPETMTTMAHDLSAYAGQTIYIALRNDSNDKFLLNVDNVKVLQVYQNDATLVSTTLNRYTLINTNNNLSFRVKNNGSNPITSLQINWNDGTDHSATITTNIAVGATATVNHTLPANYSAINTYPINVTITQVNATTDPVVADNTGTTVISTISQSPTKNVVIEEGTGTWCQYCPRGAVAMDYMYTNYPQQFIGIAVHNDDPMAVTAYDNGANFSGYPSANVDRAILDGSVSSSAFEGYYNQRKNLITPASVTGTAVSANGSVTVDLSATFYSNFPNSNFRLAAIMVEDDVTGTTSGYNQVNAYANNALGAMGGYESKPNPVPAAQMVYNHVGRALLGGYDGQAASVPAALTDGQVVNYSFNYTVPATSDVSKMIAVALIIDNESGEIINANKISITGNVGINDVNTIELNVYPNPATDKLNVSFEADGGSYAVEITDLQGRTVSTQNFSNLNGAQNIEVNTSELKAGNYLISVAKEGASFTKMIAIQ